MNIVNAAHVDSCKEASDITNNATSQRKQNGRAVGAGHAEFRGQLFDCGKPLELLTGSKKQDRRRIIAE